MAIKLPNPTEKAMISSIRTYFVKELEQEDIGEMKAGFLLSFILKEIAPTIYNQAISDAQSKLQDAVSDLNGSCYEAEFNYWNKKKP
jgi:uncharacterized protein (DUF2164 family)